MSSLIAFKKTRLLFMTGALFFAAVSAVPVHAQGATDVSQLINQINQLEIQVQTLSRAVYRGDSAAISALGSADGAGSTAAANTEVRMSAIEDQQRALTGQLEKISYDIQQLKDKADRMQVDMDQRLQQIERGASSGGASSGTLTSGETGAPADALYEEAFANVREAKYDEAEIGFKRYLSQYPNHTLAANAQYWLGETYYVRGDYKLAAKTFAQGYQDFPKSAKAADSLLKLGLSLSKLGKKDDACLSLKQLQKEFPGDTGTSQVKAAREIKQLGCL